MFAIITPKKTLYLQEGETLLAALKRAGVLIEYQCLQGYCGSCRTQLKEGKISYSSKPLAYLHEGEILPCCCQVESDLIIDDVRYQEEDKAQY